MATTIPACLALMEDTATFGTRRFFSNGWVDGAPPTTSLLNSQRTLLNAAIVAGTVTTKADVVALFISAATAASCSLQQCWQYVCNTSDPAA
jgi:hypothetical protein